MAKFSKASKEKLEKAHPLQQALWNEVIKVIDCTILETFRDKAKQNRLFDLGKSRVKWPDSNHNSLPSIAVDAAPYYIDSPHIRWNKKSLFRWYYFSGIVKGIATRMDISIRWGGDWNMDTYVKDQRFNDLPHFELVKLTLTTLIGE